MHFRNDDGWKSRYDIDITFNDGKRRLGGDFWQRTVEGTLSIYKDSVTILIPENAKYFHARVSVPQAGVILDETRMINPERVLSKFLFLKNGKTITEHNYYIYDTLHISFDVRIPVDSLIYLVVRNKQQIRRIVLPHLKVGVDTITIIFDNFEEGRYRHIFNAYGLQNESNIVDFIVEIPFYFSDKKYLERVEQLRYIATPEQMRDLKSKKDPEQRLKAYDDFWLEKDPTPDTEQNEAKLEYLGRIEYTEANFGMGDLGWRSDRGKIYINYGAPDEIDKNPFEAGVRAYQIWYYYGLNLKFVFVDSYGFGRYELLYPEGVRI